MSTADRPGGGERGASGDGELDGRVALVTGAAGPGIGQASALLLARRGASVVVTDRSERRAHEVAAAVQEATGAETLALRLEVADEAEVAAACTAALARFGRVDVLVNNAGMSIATSITETTAEDWHRVLDVCLTGPFLTMRALLPQMFERGSGAVVNIASIQGWIGTDDGLASYSAAKAGLMALTRSAAAECGPRGVRVNAIAPGLIYNDGIRRMFGDEFVERQERATALGRMGRPDDIAEAVGYLASDRASFVTGEVLCVSGGLYYHP